MPDNNVFKFLHENPHVLRHVANCAPLVLWAMDRDGTVQLSVGRTLQTLGFQEGELVGRSVYELYATRPDILDYIRRALAGESFVANIDLGGVYLESHYAPMHDAAGEIQGVMGVAVDVTAHIKTEQALRASEERSTYAQQVGHVGIWEWNIQSNEIYWSYLIEPMFGFGPGEFSRTYEGFLACVHGDDRESIVNALQAAVEHDQAYQVEYRIVWPDDSIHWIYAAAEVFRDAQGQPLRMLGICQEVTKRITSALALQDGQQDLEMSQQLANIGSWRWELQSNHVTWSRELYRIYGLDPDTFSGDLMTHVVAATHPEDRERVAQSISDSLENADQENRIEYRILRPDGSVRTVWGLGQAVADRYGNIVRRVGIVQDITAKAQADETMRKLSRALEQTDDLVLITDRTGVIEFVNDALQTTTGYSREELIGAKPRLLRSGEHDASFYKKMWKTILAGNSFRDVLVNRRKDGTTYFEEKTITPLVDNNNITHFISTGKDITERVHDQQRMEFLAHHDVLTELPNRVLFTDRLEHALTRRSDHNKQLALIYMDLDRFKIINDTLGHDAGDRFLKVLSDRLRQHLRDEDTIARLGGDEFAILLEDIDSIEQVAGVARKILFALSTPFKLDEQELFVTASLGISIFPADGHDSRTLLKHADIAMYRAKDLGRNTYQFYSADMSSKAFERLSLETSLRYALEREEFILYYQPQIDLSNQRVLGTEALIRWQHPDLGLVSPADFIPILEETGLIVEVGEWVMREACLQAMRWKKLGLDNLRMAVNVSTRQFSSSNFVEVVQSVLKETAIDPQLLELEITESILLLTTAQIKHTFASILNTNVRLALDDFGTGYSSLSYLKRFPIDVLKIDRSFIRDLTTDPDDASIVEAIIALARSMNIQVVAEGVETAQQQDFLYVRGCNAMQGFLFSPPVPAEELEPILSQLKLLAQNA